jgi:hypothetical protein
VIHLSVMIGLLMAMAGCVEERKSDSYRYGNHYDNGDRIERSGQRDLH